MNLKKKFGYLNISICENFYTYWPHFLSANLSAQINAKGKSLNRPIPCSSDIFPLGFIKDSDPERVKLD